MLKIPYGKSDYKNLIEEGYFYQDRTEYIEALENHGPSYLIYLRPRRFGKSLLISTLQYYYGFQYKADFEKLFGKTYIGTHPTPNANNYLVLRFDFSGINTKSEEGTFEGFMNKILLAFKDCFTDYEGYFTNEEQDEILNQKEPNVALSAFLSAYKNLKINNKIYILIDEYDHFANEIIAFNYSYFSEIISKNGFVRKFYEIIKTATGQGIVDRIFITGVTPITVDSLTSGFNIASNITLSAKFHQLTGFDETEVAGILKGIDVTVEKVPTILDDMRAWYNGYLFNADTKTKLYNPNMVLYFAQEYKDRGDYPREMLDANIASDYTKVRQLFKIQGDEKQYLNVLETLSETGEIEGIMVSQYSLERIFTQNDLVSLLFYMGFLTIKSEEYGRYTFTFPNYVLKKLYSDYFLEMIRLETEYPFDNTKINEAIIAMAKTGDEKPFFEQISLIVKRHSTRDAAHFNENTLKAIIISLLHQQSFYFIHSEYESDWTYMDIFLEAIQGHKPTYEVALELKYLKKSGVALLEKTIEEAEIQLKGYLGNPKFSNRITPIKAWVLVLSGHKLHWKLVS
jgi:Predicted AAA-ATPase/PD-(D/E)XK nuclease superfamily